MSVCLFVETISIASPPADWKNNGTWSFRFDVIPRHKRQITINLKYTMTEKQR